MADETPEAPSEAKPAPKPRTRRAPAKSADTKAAEAKAKPATAKAPPKPRSSKRTTAKSGTAKTAAARTRKAATKATDKVGGKWGAAAIAGGVVAAAGAAAALLLKGSTPKAAEGDTDPDKGASQADGTDSSKSFQAGIADESSIPNG